MFGFAPQAEKSAPVPSAPVLDLSGHRLRRAFENMVQSAEPTGGVERYITALMLKASLFEELLGKGHIDKLTKEEFLDLAAFVTPVRRRIGQWLADNDFSIMRQRLIELLMGWSDTASADERIAGFVASFPADKAHRWVRDLAAEVLHFTAPDRYPLMCRWVWDAKVKTGVLREIWHAEDVDAAKIDADDDYLMHSTLSEELQGFLAAEGVFRDLPFYTDLLMAHVYAARAVLPGMIARERGSIVNIASTAGKWGSRNQSAYNVSKQIQVAVGYSDASGAASTTDVSVRYNF